jgi:hypothetical protein
MTTTALKTALYQQETSEGVICLITITHAALSPAVRVCDEGVNVVSRGNTFLTYPFQFQFPSDSPDSPPSARLTIDNVDQKISKAVQLLPSSPDILVELIRLGDLDTVELSVDGFKFSNINVDGMSVQGELTVENFLLEPYPGDLFTPATFPGGF